MKKAYIILSLCFSINIIAQKNIETQPPFNIKTISFVQNGKNVIPFFKLGETFEIQFDDLFATEADYYYTIEHFNYDWSKSNLAKVEYLKGLDNQRIITYENSFNTLQLYAHYRQSFPNKFNSFTKTGNYLITIKNSDDEIVFTRKFILYEEQVGIALTTKRARDKESLNKKQNIELTINYGNNLLQNPVENVKVEIYQNGNWNTSIRNIKPQYTLGSQLIYKYNTETQFWAGNEFYTFDNSLIRIINNSVGKVTSGEIYNSILYTNFARKNSPYTYFPDFNGNYVIINKAAENNQIEADYAWVYFSLEAPKNYADKDFYVTGMFNNYAFTDENKMVYNKKNNQFEKAILLKQGYINYYYTIKKKDDSIDYENDVNGNFYLTENDYTVLVYYRGNNDRYDRVIGIANTNSEGITN